MNPIRKYSDNNETKVVVDFGIIGIFLFIVFLVLQLAGVIDWSWWWITAPLWIQVALFVSLLAVFCVMFAVCAIVAAIRAFYKMGR